MKYGIEDSDWKRICEVFSQFPHIESATLFGSRAKGTYKPFSDIDIALKGEGLCVDDILRLHSDMDDLLLPYEFDFCIYDNIVNEEFRNHIDRVGQEIFSCRHDS